MTSRTNANLNRMPARLPAWLLSGLMAVAIVLQVLPAEARDAPASFADLAAKLLPAVVNISTTQTIRNPERLPEMPQFPPGSPFEEFFKDFMEHQHQQDAKPQHATSLGSGFIVDPAGYVVTNNHVIQDADEITVTLHDDTVFKATVVGRDTKTDLALLKIDPGKKALTAVAFGPSDTARVGDWVLCIGNPYGLGGTVTAGIVSARARNINAGPYDDFLQTDASINRGNSGGPMFNVDGQVIGINTAIFSPSGGSIGIGFAIPSSLAKPVIDDLRKFGKTRRGWLGVRIQSLDQDLAQSVGLPNDQGAMVAQVTPGSPAAKAGIKAGDVILRFDGKPVTEMRELPRIVAETEVGKTVDMDIWRDGKNDTIKVKVGELKEEPEQAKTEEKPAAAPVGQAVGGTGMSVAELTPALREHFNLDDQVKGVVVVEVKGGAAAADKGLKPGDVISEAGHQQMQSPHDLIKVIDRARSDDHPSVLLLVENPQGIHYVALPLDGSKDKK